MKKLLRNLLLPKKAFVVKMYKLSHAQEKRVFLDEKTMERWMYMMKDDGYVLDGYVESIPLLVNNKGN